MANKYAPDHGEDWYREQYVGKGRSAADIAQEEGLSSEGVRDRLKNYGIEIRQQPEYDQLREHDWLEEKYVDEKKTAVEIAELVGCSDKAVYHWLRKYDISRRSLTDYATMAPAAFYTTKQGYEAASSGYKRKSETFQIHRLLAVAEWGMDAVSGAVVHHKNHIPWDNRPENIELMAPSEHSAHHYPHALGGEPVEVEE